MRRFYCQLDVNKNDKRLGILKKIMKMMGLNDCWISTGKNYQQGLTWCNGNNIPQSTLNYVFSSEHMNFPFIDISLRQVPYVDNARFSDHLGVNFKLYTG